jgi:poly(3-hydroxybutyrate) depolymerase
MACVLRAGGNHRLSIMNSKCLSLAATLLGRWLQIAAALMPAGAGAADLDFGDAPAGYPVTLAEDGARHGTATALRLGSSRNVEPDGIHTPAANAAAEDDDGVSGPLAFQADSRVMLTITVTAACRLDAWVDWAGNGQWQGVPVDRLDRIAAALPLVPGANSLAVFVPPFAHPGVTFARYRVSSAGGLPPTGEAADGEVEDYPVMITAALTGGPPALAVGVNDAGRRVIRWQGNPAYCAQFEYGRDLADWRRIELPFTERAGGNEFAIPLTLLATPNRFFRLARQPLVTATVPLAPGDYPGLTFVHAGLTRRYHLKIPAGWMPSQAWPIALILPGHGQSIEEFVANQEEILGMADARGWILVFAEATEGPTSHAWFCYDNPNTAAAPYTGSQPYVDDAGFLLALMDYLKTSGLHVNPARIHAAGFSNGGGMVHYLAAQEDHPFAAFAIIESGTRATTFFPTPYDRDAPASGEVLPASVPLPWQPRPVLLMNMVTSINWQFEGQLLGIAGFLPGARHNVARWTNANGYGWLSQPAPEPPLPVAPPMKLTTPWSTAGTARAPVRYEAMRPDPGWPAALVAQGGWTTAEANRFPYGEAVVPAALRAEYPHTISPDPANSTRIRVDSGTMITEIWRSGPGVRTNEVVFVGLSDGGHAWTGTDDKLPFNTNVSVLDFFEAH